MARARPVRSLSRGDRRGRARFAVIALVLLVPAGVSSQRRVFAEGRLDAIFSTASSVQAGVGVGVPAGTYVRILLIAGAGRTLDSPSRAIGRAELISRFVLDPFAESRFAPYGLAGLGAICTEESAQPRIVVGLGLEGPTKSGRAVAAEIALGGGLRLGLALRSTRSNRR